MKTKKPIHERTRIKPEECEELFLEYTNDFLTVQGFASYYRIGKRKALNIIEIGRNLNNNKK